MAERAARGSANSGPPFFLEAHFYDGGLRVKSFGGRSGRPSWVPPSDSVGFRNEFPLEGEDAAIEFARFAFQKCRVTWVGVFKRSIDQVFGDRQNYAGVGVWLLETHVIDASNLLISLKGLASEIAAGKMDAIAAHVSAFTGEEYLPKYLQQRERLPDQLAGWPYRGTGLSETALFLAGGRPDEAWEAAADQILRMSLLPAPSPTISRAVILVPASGTQDAGSAVRKDLTPVRKGFASELLAHLPGATSQIVEENRKWVDERQSLANQLQEREAALKKSLEARALLQVRIRDLEELIEDNDVLKKLNAMDGTLKHLRSRGGVMETELLGFRQTLASIHESVKRSDTPIVPQPHPHGASLNATSDDPPLNLWQSLFGGKSMRLWAFAIWGVVALLSLAWLAGKVQDYVRRDALPPLNTSEEARGNAAVPAGQESAEGKDGDNNAAGSTDNNLAASVPVPPPVVAAPAP